MRKTTPTEETASVGSHKAYAHLEIRVHSSMKGRLRSPSATGSPHQNWKGDGKDRGDGSAKGTQKCTGKSPPGKWNRPLCTNFKKGSCQREIHVIFGMFTNEHNSNLQVDADLEASVRTHTAKLADDKKNSP